MPELDTPPRNHTDTNSDEHDLTSFPVKKKRPVKAFMLGGGVLLLMLIGGLLWWLHASQYEATDDATLVGHLHPVSARVSGTVLSVHVDDNQQVKQGQALVTLDSEDYQVALNQARHNLLMAEAQAKTASENIPYTQSQVASQVAQARGGLGASQALAQQSREGISEAQAEVDTARQALQQQEANLQKAAADYRRYKGADPEAVSAQQIDVVSTAYKVAQAARDAARAGLSQAQARLAQSKAGVSTNVSKITQSQGVLQGAQAQGLQLNVVKSQYESAKAAIEAAKDAVKQAELNLSYTHIAAPVPGRVGQRNVEVGQHIQAGEPLMSVVDPAVWVVANYKETQLKRMRPGQTVEIDIDAFPDHPFKGVVQSFSPASGAQFALLPPENATGNFTKIVQRIPVKILLDPKSIRGYEDLLTPGMSTVVHVHVTEKPKRKA